LRYYVQSLWGRYLALLVLPVAGLAWSLLAQRRLPPGLGFVLSLLAAALIVPLFIIQGKQEQQYGLAVVPLLGLAGAWGVAALSRPADEFEAGQQTSSEQTGGRADGSNFQLVCWSAGLLACFVLVLRGDIVGALRPPTFSRAPTWIDD